MVGQREYGGPPARRRHRAAAEHVVELLTRIADRDVGAVASGCIRVSRTAGSGGR